MYSKDFDGYNTPERVYVYGLGGERLGSYILKNGHTNTPYFVLESHQVYYGGRLIQTALNTAGVYTITNVTQDRLGTLGKAYPYGESKPNNGVSIFATYTRDSGGMDYALNRYYYNPTGRFMTPDPYQASGGPSDPGSWNRYAYVQGDPTNHTDRTGLAADFCAGDDAPGICAQNHDWSGGCFLGGVSVGCGTVAGLLAAGAVLTTDQYQSSFYSQLATDQRHAARLAAQKFGDIFDAFLLALRNSTLMVGTHESIDVLVTLVGFTNNVQIPNATFSGLAAAEGFKDPLSFNHDGPSYYLGYFGLNTGHVVDSPDGVEAHYDKFGPFNPAHWFFEYFPSLLVNPSWFAQPVPYACSIAKGCSARGPRDGRGRP